MNKSAINLAPSLFKRRRLWLLLCLAPLFAAVSIALFHRKYQEHLYQKKQMEYQRFAVMEPQIVMHSSHKFHEVRVPFSFHGANTEIIFQASFGGPPLRCILDTGGSDVICPKVFCRSAQRTDMVWPSYTPIIGKTPRAAEIRVVSHIRIGDYEADACPVMAYHLNRTDTSDLTLPILGNSVFAKSVLTIDYRRHELILRDADYDPLPALHGQSSSSRVPEHIGSVDFHWAKAPCPLGPGAPVMSGDIAGHPATILLDTGANISVVTDPMLIAALRHDHAGIPRHLYRYYPKTETLLAVPWSIGKVHSRDAMDLFPAGVVWGVADANLGESSLQQFRSVTIDYPRHRVLFELNR